MPLLGRGHAQPKRNHPAPICPNSSQSSAKHFSENSAAYGFLGWGGEGSGATENPRVGGSISSLYLKCVNYKNAAEGGPTRAARRARPTGGRFARTQFTSVAATLADPNSKCLRRTAISRPAASSKLRAAYLGRLEVRRWRH
jgi:hypothetical protein